MDYKPSVDLSTEIETDHGTLNLDFPVTSVAGILNQPGIIKRTRYFGAFISKSIGPRPRKGYDGPTIAYGPLRVREKSVGGIVFPLSEGEPYLPEGSIVNAVGLKNPGYVDFAKEMKDWGWYPFTVERRTLPFLISVFANEPRVLARMVRYLSDICDGFELNYSCPNSFRDEEGEEKIGQSIGKSHELVAEFTSACREATDRILIAKLTPNVDLDSIPRIAESVVEAGADAISAINTVSTVTPLYDNDTPILTREQGGLSGPLIYPLALQIVSLISDSVDVPIIGEGGINSPERVLGMIEAGASAVGIGSYLADRNMTTEERTERLINLYRGLERSLHERGFNTLSEYMEEYKR